MLFGFNPRRQELGHVRRRFGAGTERWRAIARPRQSIWEEFNGRTGGTRGRASETALTIEGMEARAQVARFIEWLRMRGDLCEFPMAPGGSAPAGRAMTPGATDARSQSNPPGDLACRLALDRSRRLFEHIYVMQKALLTLTVPVTDDHAFDRNARFVRNVFDQRAGKRHRPRWVLLAKT
jgi:hypothetical protein